MDTNKEYPVIWAIILIAIAVRLWGISFGLPHTECRPDESIITDIIYSPLRAFNPGTFNYPSLYKYMVLCLYIIYFLIGIITGNYHSIAEVLAEYEMHPVNFYLINRFLSASFGVATVFVVYKMTEYFLDKKTAVISAIFLSLAHLHVRDSHFGTVDVPLTFFIMCSMYFIVKANKERAFKNYFMAGICTGLAASTKYQGILLFIPMFAAHCLNIAEEKDKKMRLIFDGRILSFLLAAIIFFLLGTPYAILSFSNFISDILYESAHLKYGHGIILGAGWWYHIRYSLFYGLGWSLLAASLLGIIVLAGTNIKKALILCSFPFIYYIYMGRGNTVFLRYAIPLVPFLCITAAVFTIYISSKLASRLASFSSNILTYFLAAVILLPSAHNVVLSDRLLAKKDNRLQAAEWINKNITKASSIYQISLFPPGKIQLYPAIDSLPKIHYNIITRISYRIPESVRVYMLLYLKDRHITGYEQWNYGIAEKLPEYIIAEKSPLSLYSILQKDAQEVIKKSYRLRQSFIAIDMNDRKSWFDQQDAFYLPFAGFAGVERPGPNFYIYERNDLLKK